MTRKIVKSCCISLFAALVLLFGLTGGVQAQAPAGACTQYVAAKRSLAGYPNAFQWATNGYLARKGYRQVAAPVVGAIVVYQPGVNNTDPIRGHVALVEFVQARDATGRIPFGIRGAAQGTSNVTGYPRYFTDGGYSNVSVRWSSLGRGQQGISFWVK